MTPVELKFRELMVAVKAGTVSVNCATAQAARIAEEQSMQDNIGMFSALERQNRVIEAGYPVPPNVFDIAQIA